MDNIIQTLDEINVADSELSPAPIHIPVEDELNLISSVNLADSEIRETINFDDFKTDSEHIVDLKVQLNYITELFEEMESSTIEAKNMVNKRLRDIETLLSNIDRKMDVILGYCIKNL
jgi:hypothetical protein